MALSSAQLIPSFVKTITYPTAQQQSVKLKKFLIISQASSSFSKFYSPKTSRFNQPNRIHTDQQGCLSSSPSVANYNLNAFKFQSHKSFAAQSQAYSLPPEDAEEAIKRSLAMKQIENSAASFKRLGRLGFWAQLICSVVSAVILVFSVYISGRPTSPATTYLTAGGIVSAFLSVFWSFGYMRLGDRLREVLNTNLEKAPSRTSVVDNLKSGLVINLVGMAATLLGLQATVGLLVAKALSSSVTPIAQGLPASYNPVLALDVFLVQASSNTLLSHFLGLIFTLELIRITTRPQPPSPTLPKPA